MLPECTFQQSNSSLGSGTCVATCAEAWRRLFLLGPLGFQTSQIFRNPATQYVHEHDMRHGYGDSRMIRLEVLSIMFLWYQWYLLPHLRWYYHFVAARKNSLAIWPIGTSHSPMNVRENIQIRPYRIALIVNACWQQSSMTGTTDAFLNDVQHEEIAARIACTTLHACAFDDLHYQPKAQAGLPRPKPSPMIPQSRPGFQSARFSNPAAH